MVSENGNAPSNPDDPFFGRHFVGYLPALIAASVIFLAGLYAIQLNRKQVNSDTRLSVAKSLNIVRARLEGNIHSNAQLVKGLVASIATEPNINQKRFAELATILFHGKNQLRNIGAAPDLIISMMYPMKGNEKAINLDYRKNAAQREAALKARDLRQLILAGPVNLVQGGQGFIGRVPVFIDERPGLPSKFWGLISTVINVEKLYRDSGLLNEDLTIDIAIRGKDAEGAEGDQFYGRQEILTNNPVLAKVSLPYGSWLMAAIPKGGWQDRPNNEWILYLVFLLAEGLVVIPILIIGRLLLERQKIIQSLHEAKSESELANKAKSEFLAAMSHDLRTPLNAIMGFSDMIRVKAFGPLGNARYEEYANYIYDSGTLLVSLINDVLDLSKIEAGKYELIEEPLDVSSLVQVSFRQLMNMAEASNQHLSAAVSPDLPALQGDEKALIQVLNNLLSNAIKFTPDGGKIGVVANLDESESIVLRIADTGIGMSEHDLAKALQPFEQAGGMHSRRHEGTGLGLHLCANFMRLFGGSIGIESEVGKGTTVTLVFPPERTVAS